MWDMKWIELVQDRDTLWALVNTVMNLRFSQNARFILASGEPATFSRMTLLHEVSK